MKKSILLRQEMVALVASQTAIVDKATNEKRDLSSEEATNFDALQKQIDDKDAELQRAVKHEENLKRAASLAGADAGSGDGGEGKELDKMKEKFSISRALSMASSGKFEGVEKEIHEMGASERRAMGREVSDYGFAMPSSMVRADAQTVSEDSGSYGGALVTDMAPRVVSSFIPKLFLEELGATFLPGLTGPMSLPVMSDYTFQWLDETEAITKQKATVAGPKLTPKRAGAQVAVSKRLLGQSSANVNMLVMNKLGEGAARALNFVAIQGASASKQPVGILNTSGVLAAAGTTPVVPTWALITELQGLLDINNASSENLGYLCSPKLLALLKTITKDAGSGRFLAENGLIDGFRTVATSLVPFIPEVVSPATPELHHLIYGDFSQLFIGQFGAIEFVADPLTGASQNSVIVTVNMEADCQIANPKGFARNSFLKLA